MIILSEYNDIVTCVENKNNEIFILLYLITDLTHLTQMTFSFLKQSYCKDLKPDIYIFYKRLKFPGGRQWERIGLDTDFVKLYYHLKSSSFTLKCFLPFYQIVLYKYAPLSFSKIIICKLCFGELNSQGRQAQVQFHSLSV